MELKYNEPFATTTAAGGFNRTFMELKFVERLEREEANKKV